MSVLIKGMEMPKCCDACSFAWWSNLHQTGSCDLLDSKQCFDDYSTDYRTKRSEHCPLTEVPEPHGRLIDADKLKETLDYYISEAGWSDEINKALSWVKDEFIDSEQTVIPASEEAE